MITCNITNDYDLVRSVLSDPSILPHIVEDIHIELDKDAKINETYIYFELRNDKDLYGIAMLQPRGFTCWELHTCLLPIASGQSKVCAYTLMIKLLEFPYVEKLVTWIPEYNKPAIKAAENAGFKEEGYVSDSWLKDGKLIGQYIYGITL